MKLLIAFLCGLGLYACQGCATPGPLPPPFPPDPNYDPGPAPMADGGLATCADLCEHRSRLGCKAAQPTPGGHSCLEVCRNMADGPVVLDLTCRSSTATCDESACR